MSEVKWIKIVTDIFDDEKMLLIESLPAADSIITIWFKLLCLAGKQNNRGVFLLNERIAYTDQMLSTIFRRELTTVQLALRTFQEFGMIEIIDGVITIPNWEKHQSLEKYQEHKEKMREYMREKRKEQKLIAQQEEVSETFNKRLLNQPETFTEVSSKNKKEEEEKEEEGEKDKLSESVEEVVDYLNQKAGTKYRAKADGTRKFITGRLSEGYSADDLKTIIDKKAREWLGTDMARYLRPETLFSKSHAESYLNQPDQNTAKKAEARKGSYFAPTQRSMSYAEYQAAAVGIDEEDEELPFGKGNHSCRN